MGWLTIRNTDVSVLDILDAIAEDGSCEKIIRRFPSMFPDDIASAAATARYLILYHWAICRSPELALQRRVSGKSRLEADWSWRDELELKRLFREGAGIENIARIFKCPEIDITNRLKRLNMI